MSYYGQRSPMDSMTAAIIIVVSLVLGGVVVARCSTGISGEDQRTAEQEAREFATKMGIKVTGVSCAKTDSDGDGYVSCTLSVQQPDGSMRMEPIECARALTINEGCRMQKPGVQQR